MASSWEERVRKLESRQQEALSEALANQLQQTLHEETRQSEPERIRDAEFMASMMTLHQTFLKNEKSREQAFRDTELEQEKLAKQSEDSRDTRFRLANDKRDVLFQRDCEARQKRSDLYTDIRDRDIRQRRDSREATFRKLEAMLQEQIDTTWRLLELVSPAQVIEEDRETVRVSCTIGYAVNTSLKIRNVKSYSPVINGKQKSSTVSAPGNEYVQYHSTVSYCVDIRQRQEAAPKFAFRVAGVRVPRHMFLFSSFERVALLGRLLHPVPATYHQVPITEVLTTQAGVG